MKVLGQVEDLNPINLSQDEGNIVHFTARRHFVI